MSLKTPNHLLIPTLQVAVKMTPIFVQMSESEGLGVASRVSFR